MSKRSGSTLSDMSSDDDHNYPKVRILHQKDLKVRRLEYQLNEQETSLAVLRADAEQKDAIIAEKEEEIKELMDWEPNEMQNLVEERERLLSDNDAKAQDIARLRRRVEELEARFKSLHIAESYSTMATEAGVRTVGTQGSMVGSRDTTAHDQSEKDSAESRENHVTLIPDVCPANTKQHATIRGTAEYTTELGKSSPSCDDSGKKHFSSTLEACHSTGEEESIRASAEACSIPHLSGVSQDTIELAKDASSRSEFDGNQSNSTPNTANEEVLSFEPVDIASKSESLLRSSSSSSRIGSSEPAVLTSESHQAEANKNSVEGKSFTGSLGPTTKGPSHFDKLQSLKEVLSKVITNIKKKDRYGFFLHPVDVSQVAGYTDVVKHPMDFGTIDSKVGRGVYRSLEEFTSDIRLVVSNAKLFNAAETIYYTEAGRIETWALEHIKKAASALTQHSAEDTTELKKDLPPSASRVGVKSDTLASHSSDCQTTTGPLYHLPVYPEDAANSPVAQQWFRDAFRYINVALGEEWAELVRVWIRYERSMGWMTSSHAALPKGKGNGTRPDKLSGWIKDCRYDRNGMEPEFKGDDLVKFVKQFLKWWVELRRERASLVVGGKNGWLSVLACLKWWKLALGKESPTPREWLATVEEVSSTLEQLTEDNNV